MKKSTHPLASIGEWGTLVTTELARVPEQQLILTALRDEANPRELRLKVTTKYLVAQPGRTYRAVLNYVEDTLTGKQKDYSLPAPSAIFNYLHRHILRDAPLTTFGAVSAVAPTANQTVTTYLRYPLPDEPWATRPAQLVAYLLDATDPRLDEMARDASGGDEAIRERNAEVHSATALATSLAASPNRRYHVNLGVTFLTVLIPFNPFTISILVYGHH